MLKGFQSQRLSRAIFQTTISFRPPKKESTYQVQNEWKSRLIAFLKRDDRLSGQWFQCAGTVLSLTIVGHANLELLGRHRGKVFWLPIVQM
jgi:hypothetical protein